MLRSVGSHPSSPDGKKAATLPYRIRRALIEDAVDTLPVRTQASLLCISRTHLYYQPLPPAAREVAIKHRIDELFTALPFYGSRRIQALLEPECGSIARNTVRHYMHELGSAAVYPGPNLSKRHTAHRVYPDLLRHITAAHPNHIWGVDITYVRSLGDDELLGHQTVGASVRQQTQHLDLAR